MWGLLGHSELGQFVVTHMKSLDGFEQRNYIVSLCFNRNMITVIQFTEQDKRQKQLDTRASFLGT